MSGSGVDAVEDAVRAMMRKINEHSNLLLIACCGFIISKTSTAVTISATNKEQVKGSTTDSENRIQNNRRKSCMSV